MFKWFKNNKNKKLKREKDMAINNVTVTQAGSGYSTSIGTSSLGGVTTGYVNTPYGYISGTGLPYQTGTYGTYGTYGYSATINPGNVVVLFDTNNAELVSLKSDGTVEWANNIKIDEAAEAFSKAMVLSSELSAGITQSVKHKMRDSVFEDLINIAKEKGSLTAEDLTYLLEASKIVEKMKGPK